MPHPASSTISITITPSPSPNQPWRVPFVEYLCTHVNFQRPPIFRCMSPCGRNCQMPQVREVVCHQIDTPMKEKAAPPFSCQGSGRMPSIILAKHNYAPISQLPVTAELARFESHSTFQKLQLCFPCTSKKSPLQCVFSSSPLHQLTICLSLFTQAQTAHIELGGSAKTRSSSRPLTVTANIPRYYGSLV